MTTPSTVSRQQILEARQAGDLSAEQASALLDALSRLQQDDPDATLTKNDVDRVLAGGQPEDRRGFLARQFGGVTSADERDKGTFTRSSFGIPLPFTDEEIGVNLPLAIIGATAITAGATAPAGGDLAAARTAPLIGSRTILPGLNAVRGATAASRVGGLTGAASRTITAGGVTAIGGGAIGSSLQEPISGQGLPTAPPSEPAGGTSAADAARADLGRRPKPTGPEGGGPIERNPVIDSSSGEPIPGQFFYTRDGKLLDPRAIELTPDEADSNQNFIQTREGQEFLNAEREEASALNFQRSQQLAAFERQRDESLRQGNFAEARAVAGRQREFLASESRAQRDASFVNALLPILASPGSRFRFAANVSRLGGGQAQFTPTEAFGRLFRFSGFTPGSAVPLTGQQDFSIIPNIQQFADLGPRDREELEAIVGESSGQSLFGIGRQSKRLAPPR